MILEQSVRPALAELRTSPRLRWGVWGIVGILWLYAALVMRDEVPRQNEAFRAVSKKIARTKAIASQGEWVTRRDEAMAVQVELENRLWRESTIGLAKATFQDWLNQQLQQASISGAQLVVSAQDDEGGTSREPSTSDAAHAASMPGLWKVTARLAFDFSPRTFNPFLARILAHDKRVVVESLIIRGAPSQRGEMLLVAYFQKPSAVSQADSSARRVQR